MKTLGDYIHYLEQVASLDKYVFVLENQTLLVYIFGTDTSNPGNAIGHFFYKTIDSDNPLKISPVEIVTAARYSKQELKPLIYQQMRKQGFEIFE